MFEYRVSPKILFIDFLRIYIGRPKFWVILGRIEQS